ncbi:uncharacterized protein LOC118451515 [Vespa mandarinia]|uniref:uncharacterized protein LOC118451515 n=1 Tax=Vespa mandarinia TaxID=7446 RepID=UPI001620E9AF|nr:uncharacterized protein LOC118451515 [Vespa mandarinia]XP_035744063.1 uncharacterized protein LOC118451515 [Vespa mandarinia]
MESYVEKIPLITTSISSHYRRTFNVQLVPKCADFELKAIECYEAYGYQGGRKKQLCQDYLADLKECLFKRKSILRLQTMHEERMRQYKEGIRKKEDIFAPSPPQDSL